MLSFKNGRKFLYLVDKENKIKHTIFYNNKGKSGKTDIQVEDPLSVLNKYDFKTMKKRHRLSEYDLSQIKKYLKNKNREKINNGVYLNVYDKFLELIDHRISRSLIFDDNEYKQMSLVPAIKGYTVISIIGSSGSGKSTLASKIIQVNKKKDQKVYLLSRQLNTLDPAFKNFEDDVIELDTNNLEELPSIEDLEDQWLLIDDLEGLKKEIRDYLLEYINSIITTGRKLKIKTIFSAHLFNGYIFKQIANESRFIFMFPDSNSVKVKNDLRLKYGYSTSERNIILDEVRKDKSRFLGMHLASPNCYFTSHRVSLE